MNPTETLPAAMTLIVWTYAIYLLVSFSITVWVAKTLHKNGRIFLVNSFGGNELLANSVNHLLVVGFYLMNISYVTLALKYGVGIANARQAKWFAAGIHCHLNRREPRLGQPRLTTRDLENFHAEYARTGLRPTWASPPVRAAGGWRGVSVRGRCAGCFA